MSAKSFFIGLMSCIACSVATYIATRSVIHYEVIGKVVDSKSIVFKDNDNAVMDNLVTIQRADGAKVVYSNEDDFLIGKDDSKCLANRLATDQMVRVTVNGFGNIVAVQWLSDDEPKEASPVKEEEPVGTNDTTTVEQK